MRFRHRKLLVSIAPAIVAMLCLTARSSDATAIYNDGTTNWVGEVLATPGFGGGIFDSFAVLDLRSGNTWSDLTGELSAIGVGLEEQVSGRPGTILSQTGSSAPLQRFLYLYRSHVQDDPGPPYVRLQQTGVAFDVWGQIRSLTAAPLGAFFCDAAQSCTNLGSLSSATTQIRWETLPYLSAASTLGDVIYDGNANTLSFDPDILFNFQGDTTVYWGLSDLPPVWTPHHDFTTASAATTLQPGHVVPEPSPAWLIALGLLPMSLRARRRAAC